MPKTRLRLALLALLLPLRALAQSVPEPPEPPAMEAVTTVGTPGPGQPAGTPYPVFAPGQVLTAAQLNAALAAPTIVGGSINGVPIGLVNQQEGRFSTLRSIGPFQQDTGTAIFAGTGTWQVGDGNATKRAIFTSHYAPQAGTLYPLVLMQGNAFGTISNNVPTAFFRGFNINADSVNAAGAQGGGIAANYFGHTISAGAVGGRTTLSAQLFHSGATTVPITGNQFYVAIAGFGRSTASAGGTSGTAAGFMFGSNFGAYLRAGAGLYWRQAVGMEINVGVAAGARAEDKVGIQVVQGLDEVQSTGTDAAYVLAATSNNAVAGWKHGLLFGARHGTWPMAPNGTLIGTAEQNGSLPQRYQMTTANGIDFATVPVIFTGRALSVPGFAIDGTGQTTIGSNTIGWSSAGLSIGAAGKVGALSSIPGGGSGTYLVGDILRDAYGGVWVVSTVNGSNQVTGLTMHKAPTITSGSPPSNPLALSGTSGRAGSASINVAWADAGEIRLTAGRLRHTAATVAATGTTQGTAAPLPVANVVLITASSGQTGVIMPPAVPGNFARLKVGAGVTATLYPASGENFVTYTTVSAPNAGVIASPGTFMAMECFTAGEWTVIPFPG